MYKEYLVTAEYCAIYGDLKALAPVGRLISFDMSTFFLEALHLIYQDYLVTEEYYLSCDGGIGNGYKRNT